MKGMLFFAVLVVALTLLTTMVVAQPTVNYNDVALLYNRNVDSSGILANYFKAARNIPAANVIGIDISSNEEVDSTTFNSLRSQIESALDTLEATTTINYLVTCKGLPLKVNRGNTFSQTSPSSSVESELMLIRDTLAHYIGGSGPQMNPYFYFYQNAAHFSRATYRIYLVSRLDAYSFAKVMNMIDRSGPNIVLQPTSKWVFDQDPSRNTPLNRYMHTAATNLHARGMNVVNNADTVYVTDLTNVISYRSFGSNDNFSHWYTNPPGAIGDPRFTFVPGSVAEEYVSTSGRSFNYPPSYGQSLFVDLLAEGCTGGKTTVYEPYSNAMSFPYIVLDRYTNGYNLAESFFMGSLLVSWMDVVVGDPKTSLYISGGLPIQLASFTGRVVNSASVQLDWTTLSETNNYGFDVQHRSVGATEWTLLGFVPGNGTTLQRHDYSYTDNTVMSGSWQYRLVQIDLDGVRNEVEPITVVMGTMSVNISEKPLEFKLEQNYPNPFNPSTVISFQLAVSGYASLKVYNMLGQEVATLVDEVQQAGEYTVQFDGQGLASGVYIYRLQGGGNVATQRMMLMK